MQKTIGLNEFYFEDSWNFIHKINNLNISKNFMIISLDIVSMYTNMTWDLIVISIKNRWEIIKQHTFLNYKEFNTFFRNVRLFVKYLISNMTFLQTINH